MTSMWELENDLNYGTFTVPATQQELDTFKVEQAFKLLTQEVQRLSIVESDMMTVRTDLANMIVMYDEILSVVRKMGRDYPEVVLAKPHLFVEDEFAVTVK